MHIKREVLTSLRHYRKPQIKGSHVDMSQQQHGSVLQYNEEQLHERP